MKLSTNGRTFLKGYERGGQMIGKRLVLLPPGEPALITYIDDVGVKTIGWGHTGMLHGRPLKMGDAISREEAEDLLSEDLNEAEGSVNRVTKGKPTNANQFDAMVLFAFNTGCAGFAGSTLAKFHNKGNYEGAAAQFGRWNKGTVNGKKVEFRGLTRRRGEEAEIYMRPVRLQERKVVTRDASHTISKPELSQRVTPDVPVSIPRTPAIIGSVATAAAVAPVAIESADHALVSKPHLWGHIPDHAFVWIAGGLSILVLILLAYIVWRHVRDHNKGLK